MGRSLRARRKHIVDDQVHHERWLVSYADFLTLLLAFFVVMYSISQVSESKYRVLSDTLTSAFRLAGDPSQPVADNAMPSTALQSGIQLVDLRPVSSSSLLTLPEEFLQVVDQLSQAMGDLESSELLAVKGNERWLQIELNSSLLFDSASAVPKDSAKPILLDLANMLKRGSQPIRVEGYTDSLPITSVQYPSNWELSGARAAAVVRALIDGGVAAERLAAVGYGEQRAIADNMTPEGRAANRRVVLMIAREEPKLSLERISLEAMRGSTSTENYSGSQQSQKNSIKTPSAQPVRVDVWMDQLLKGIVPKRPKRAAVKVPLLPPKKKVKKNTNNGTP